MFSWAFEVGTPELCVRLLTDFYGLSQEQVWFCDVLICKGNLISYYYAKKVLQSGQEGVRDGEYTYTEP